MKNIANIKEDLETIDTIVDILPDDPQRALCILSMSIDQYAAEHYMNNTQVWTTLYHASLKTRKEVGEYPRRSK